MKIFLLSNSLAILTGCAPVIVGSGMIAGGYVAVKDKPFGDSISDTKIEASVKARLYKINPELYSAISVSVEQRAVLLTGAVINPDWISLAEEVAWAVTGVEIVDNNIVCGEISFTQLLSDSLITSSCRTSLLCSKDIKSVNYKLKTFDGVVYIYGIARTKEELEKVLEVVQKVKNVNKIVSYVNATK